MSEGSTVGAKRMAIDRDTLARELSALVRVPSVTPMHAGPRSGAGGEQRFAMVVAERCRSLGAQVHLDPVMPERPNVIAVWHGGSDRWLGIDVHSDTVGVERMRGDPFGGRIEDERVFGRGAVDTKATLAICLALLQALHDAGQRPAHNLLLAITCDEEGTARGAPALATWLGGRGLQLDEMVIAEPTQCAAVHGHKGVLRQTFEVRGAAAHSATPARGRNAVLSAARLALAFEAENERLHAHEPASPLGTPTLTVSMLEGGQGPSVVPDRARLTIDRRVVTGESTEDLAKRYAAMAQDVSDLPIEVTTTHAIDAFYQPSDSPLVRGFSEWAGTEPATVAYCTNAWAYAQVARQRIVIGPGSIDQAHGEVEWVTLDELERMAQAMAAWWSASA